MSEGRTRTVRWEVPIVGLMILAFGCVDDLVPDEPTKAASVRTIPVTRERSLAPGQSVELALQVLDAETNGIDGIECFFAVSDAESLSFDEAASAESTQRILTHRDAVDSIQAAGLAVARFTALESDEASVVSVWAGIASAENVADGSEDTALQVWQFDVTITPPEPTGQAGAGGAP